MTATLLRRLGALALAASLLMIPVALAQDAPPSRSQLAIKYRQATLFLLAWNLGPIGEMVQGKRPFDAAMVQRNARALAMLSPRAIEGFVPDSLSGSPTRAKPEIWDNMADFREKFAMLEKNSQALVVAADSADLAIVGPAMIEVGKACKACHDKYKAD